MNTLVAQIICDTVEWLMRVVAEITRANLPHHVYAITRAEWRQLR